MEFGSWNVTSRVSRPIFVRKIEPVRWEFHLVAIFPLGLCLSRFSNNYARNNRMNAWITLYIIHSIGLQAFQTHGKILKELECRRVNICGTSFEKNEAVDLNGFFEVTFFRSALSWNEFIVSNCCSVDLGSLCEKNSKILGTGTRSRDFKQRLKKERSNLLPKSESEREFSYYKLRLLFVSSLLRFNFFVAVVLRAISIN